VVGESLTERGLNRALCPANRESLTPVHAFQADRRHRSGV